MDNPDPVPRTPAGAAHGWLSAWRAARRAARDRERAVAAAIEQVVDGTDRRIRAVSGYRRQLAPAVGRTLDFIAELVASLPGPVDLSRGAWQDEPHVNAFFGTADDIPTTLTRSKELRDFFQRQADARQAYALLAVTRREKRVLGMALQGDMVQREVPQTSVSFTEHRILAPAATEAAVREEAKGRALNLFVSHAQGRLADLLVRREGLERERQLQQLRLRQAQTRAQSLAAVEDEEGAAETEAIERSLAENARELEALGGALATLDDYVEQVRAVFASPEEHLGRATVSFRVSRMGIKLADGAVDPGSDLSLLELAMGPVRRVVTLVRCPREEMLSIEQFLGQVNPHLAAELGLRVPRPG
jgi:hypothetical protein